MKISGQVTSIAMNLPTHAGEKSHKCAMCGKFFGKDMKRHMRIHSGEKPFKCGQCNKSFTNLEHLNAHELTHTGAKPFKCEECEKSFAHKLDLQRHMLTHTVLRLVDNLYLCLTWQWCSVSCRNIVGYNIFRNLKCGIWVVLVSLHTRMMLRQL